MRAVRKDYHTTVRPAVLLHNKQALLEAALVLANYKKGKFSAGQGIIPLQMSMVSVAAIW
ncbi:MAG: hypothetical protein ACYS30_02260 [Planctomycetota bacterium]